MSFMMIQGYLMATPKKDFKPNNFFFWREASWNYIFPSYVFENLSETGAKVQILKETRGKFRDHENVKQVA